MRCKKWVDLVFAYQDGRLAEAEKTEFEQHLRACPACGARLGEIRTIDGLMQKAAAPVPGTDFADCWRRIAVALAPAPAPQPRLAGFRAPRWALLAAGFLAFFILGVGFARLYFSPARTETAAPADAPFLYSARDYFAALQPVLSEFSNAPARDGASTDSARLRLLLNNLQLLRLRADRNRDASLLALLDDIELVLLEIAHLDRSNSESTRLVNALIREKGIALKMKVYKFSNRKAVSI